MGWVTYALIGMLGFSAMRLIIKRLTDLQLKPEVINFYFFLFTTVAFFLFSSFRKTRLVIPVDSIPIFAILAALAIVYNFCSVSAVASAPNPGYVDAINSFRVVIVTIAAVFIFQSEITPIKLIGAALSLAGLILISL